MVIIYVALAAFVGGIVNALLGWCQSEDSFVGRKFMASVIASFIGAIVVAVAFNFTGAEGKDAGTLIAALFGAFLSGAGVSSGASRVAGSIK